eukprot:236970_1
MIFKIALLSTLISTINGASRYFISTYVQPLETGNQAYPIGVCVNYQISLVNFSPINSYGIWTCNQDKTVTFTDYGTDSTCQTSVSTMDHATSATAGEVGSFNCIGTDDYVITDGCKVAANDPGECCDMAECLPNTQALNTCVKSVDGSSYSMVTCDATKTETYSYTSAGCPDNSKSATPTTSSTVADCAFYVNQLYDIYLRMNACYQNGRGISTDSLCGYTYAPSGVTSPPVPMPTGSPTVPTSSPSKNPTESPTAPTSPPDDDGKSDAFEYSAVYSMILSIVLAFIF